jgi:hypothetical protein
MISTLGESPKVVGVDMLIRKTNYMKGELEQC